MEESGILDIKILPEVNHHIYRDNEFIARVIIGNFSDWKLVKCQLRVGEYKNCLPFVTNVDAFLLRDIDAGERIHVDIPFTAAISLSGEAFIVMYFDSVIGCEYHQNTFGSNSLILNKRPLSCQNSKQIIFEVHTKKKKEISKSIKNLMHVF